MSDKFDKDILYKFIQNKYEITLLPKHFFMKMAKVYKGTLQGISRPIPPEHLYDMWIRKSSYLDKVHMQNISKGKKIEGYVRLNYDLAILISKYDDYLKWLDKQKYLKNEKEIVKEIISTENVTHMINNEKENKKESDNLFEMLDDLI